MCRVAVRIILVVSLVARMGSVPTAVACVTSSRADLKPRTASAALKPTIMGDAAMARRPNLTASPSLKVRPVFLSL
uniref:Putative secreted protein n=1 Tax=Ixodes ricinus TaxID=34613 RepID=A0A6B0UBA4_IXORI